MKRFKLKKKKTGNKINMSYTEDDLDIIKETNSFEDFIVYDRDETKLNKSQIETMSDDNPFLKDWFILNTNPFKNQRNESRFTDLFKEILENDRKVEDKKSHTEKKPLEEKKIIDEKKILEEKKLLNEAQKKINEELKKKIAQIAKNKIQKEDRKEKEKEIIFSQQTEKVDTLNENNVINDPLLPYFGERGISFSSNSSGGCTNVIGRNSTNDSTFYAYTSCSYSSCVSSAVENQQNEKHYCDLNLDIKKMKRFKLKKKKKPEIKST